MYGVFRSLAGVILIVASLVATAVPATAATPEEMEWQFLDKINDLRASRGLVRLTPDPRLRTVARNWAAQMAANGAISHNPNLSRQAPSSWTRLGENVGVGGTVDSLHQAFVNSPGHFANLVDGRFNVGGIGVVTSGGRIWVVETFMTTSETPPPMPRPVSTVPIPAMKSYRLAAADGGVFGGPGWYGSAGAISLNQPVVGIAATASDKGYWLVARDGGIFNFGDAAFHGSTGGLRLNSPIVGIATVPAGGGYWLVGADGGVFPFGSANFFGSTGGMRLNSPIVAIAPTSTGNGYWLVSADGGVFAFGDAPFHGSTGHIRLNRSIVGISVTPSGQGYWLAASDGGVFPFGDAAFRGSTGHLRLNSPIVGMASKSTGMGYWLVSADGGIFAFGDAPFDGSAGASHLNQPIVGMAV